MGSILDRMLFRPSQPYAEPEYVQRAPDPGPFWGGDRARAIPVLACNNLTWASPWIPVRRDTYQQLAQQLSGQAVAATAPTRGIYTGLSDEEACA